MPMASEIRTPIMIRAARSRPMASVPKKKCSRSTLTAMVPLIPSSARSSRGLEKRSDRSK